MIKLKRCPFCGRTAIFVAENPFGGYVHVACSWCGARTRSDYSEEGAAKEWNRRVENEY